MLQSTQPYVRPQAAILKARLAEPRRFIQVIAGPRQVGKTRLVEDVLKTANMRNIVASADEPSLRSEAWIGQQWNAARLLSGDNEAVLVLDEIQKIPGWSDTVKRFWDEDTRAGAGLKVVLLGSAPLLISRGLSDSLAGRFELIHLRHWSYSEMRAAFGFTLDEYVYFGGYPGAAPLVTDPPRWARYVLDALIETTISRDVLLMTRVDKPVLLRRMFELGCRYSGQILSYTKMLGQLQEAGNTTTLAHYLELLAGAGMVTGLDKYAGDAARSRGSSPKLQVFNTALMTAQSGLSLSSARANPEYWGRLVESAVGAHLANAAAAGDMQLFYWRDRNHEVDFVARAQHRMIAIEVKSGRTPETHSGIREFSSRYNPHRTLLVGQGGIALEDFLPQPAQHWLD